MFLAWDWGYLISEPVMRIYKDIICHHYYNHWLGESHIKLDGSIDKSMCKKDDIQRDLGIVIAGY